MRVYNDSLIGKRSSNEDSHFMEINMNGKKANKHPVNIFGIFDGHGGKEVSQYLSKSLPKYLMDPTKINFPYKKKQIMDIHAKVQSDISKSKIGQHCGSTSLVVVMYNRLDKKYLNIFNVGDSRCVMCRNNIAVPLTLDHKPGWPSERYRIEKMGGFVHYDRPEYRVHDLSVSRSFGDEYARPCVTSEPDLFSYKIEDGDKFMIIACDGLFENLSNQEVVNFVLEYTDMGTGKIKKKVIDDNINIATELANFSIKKRSEDNISLFVVFFD